MSRVARVLVGLSAILALSTPAFAAEGDEFWWDGFGSPDLDGWVSCATEFDGSLVVGGRFTRVGDVEARNIARWDGSRWSPLGEGFDGDVLSLAVYDGELVASGRFDHNGTQAFRGIARWNGQAWSPLGSGLWRENVQVPVGALALESHAGVLYAAGDFDRAGGIEARGVARWNGTDWSALGGGVKNGSAQSLLVSGDSLYVGGWFDTAGSVPASGVAVWNGSAWSALGSGLSYSYGRPSVLDMIDYHGSLIVAGTFDSAGGQPASNLAAWNGQSWDSLASGIQETANSLALAGDTLLVAGYGIHAWDGFVWGIPPPFSSGWVSCLLQTPGGLMVGGRFLGYSSGGVAAVNVGIVRDGDWIDLTRWTDRMHGLGGFSRAQVTALASYDGGLVASGFFLYAGGSTGRTTLGPVARWDGNTWSTLGTPPYGFTSSLLASGDTLYAIGSYASYPFPSRTPVMRFDGANWSALDTLGLWATQAVLHRGALYAGGRRSTINDLTAGGVYRWDGIRWESIGVVSRPEDPFPQVNGLVEYEGRLVTGGWFETIAGVPAIGLAAWDGDSWSAMDTGLEYAFVRSLGVCEGALYAGGDFRDHDGKSTNLVRWDGARWTTVPGPRVLPVVFGCANHRLYAGGSVYDETHVQQGIMSWDGQAWSSLGSGVNDVVTAMAFHDGDLYVGGQFTEAGGKSSSAIARWDLEGERRASALLTSQGGIPNPFRTATSIAYRLAAPGHARVAVFDLRGRQIAVLEDAQRPAGTHVVTWDGHTGDGRIAPSGVYFIRLDLPGGSETRRVVRLR